MSGVRCELVVRGNRLVIAAAVVVVAGVGVFVAVSRSGDGEDDDGVRTVQPGAPGEPSREIDDDDARVDPPDHTAADVAFVQRMIVHHRQALTMAALVADRTERDDLPLLAERITVSQEDEIERLSTWLTDRDEAVPDDDDADHPDHAGTPGMTSRQQLELLVQAKGVAFDRLFLDLMVAHHQGALTMVAELYASGGGLEPEADRAAREIEADQAAEIRRLQALRDTLLDLP